MDTFSGEILAAGFGALLGAASAFLLGLLLERRRQVREDRARVTNFLVDMSTRRAFSADTAATRVSAHDAARLESAVQSLRKASREVRLALHRPPRAATEALIAITRSCNRYLEAIEGSRAGAKDLAPLHTFLAQIARSADELHLAVAPESRQHVPPGALAYPSSDQPEAAR